MFSCGADDGCSFSSLSLELTLALPKAASKSALEILPPVAAPTRVSTAFFSSGGNLVDSCLSLSAFSLTSFSFFSLSLNLIPKKPRNFLMYLSTNSQAAIKPFLTASQPFLSVSPIPSRASLISAFRFRDSNVTLYFS